MASLILEKYKLVRELSAPGVTKAWLAHSYAQGGPFLVYITGFPKSLQEHDGFRAEAENDASVVSHLRGETIAGVLDFGIDHERFWIVREVVAGEPLSGVLRAAQHTGYPSVPVPLALRWVSAAARALETAHSQRDSKGWSLNIVHGGITPHNVFLHHTHQVRIAEFTTARLRHKANYLSKNRAFPEVLRYRAPEQIRKEEPTAQTDIFLLGLVLWEMLVGHSPFTHEEDFDRQILSGPPPAPSSSNRAVSEEIDAVLRKALEPSAADRYASAEAMADAIDRAATSFKPAFGAVPDVDRLMPDRMSAWRSFESALRDEDLEKAIAWAERSLFEVASVSRKTKSPGRTPASENADTARLSNQKVKRALGRGDEEDASEEDRRELANTLVRGSAPGQREPEPDPGGPTREQPSRAREDVVPDEETAPVMRSHRDEPSSESIRETGLADTLPTDTESPARAEVSAGISGTSSTVDDDTTSKQLVDEEFSSHPAPEEPQRAGEPGTADPVQHAADLGRRSIGTPIAAEPPSGVGGQGIVPGLGEFAAWGEEDEEEEPFVEPFDVDLLIGAPGRELSAAEAGTKPAAEVIRVVDGRVLDSKVLSGMTRFYREKGQNVSVRLGMGKASIRFDPQFVSGWVERAQGERVKVSGGSGKLEMNPGDRAELDDQGVMHRVRVFYPPTPPRRKKAFISSEGVRLAGVTFVVSLFMHVLAFLGFMLTAQLGVDLTVKKQEPVEVFAEGKLKAPEEKPEPPKKEPPKPKPKKKIAPTKPADPTEQAAIIPKSIRKKLDKRLKEKRTAPTEEKAEDLLAQLTSPVQGEGETIKDVVTNIDAANTGSSSAAFKVAGTLKALGEGEAPNIATGGGGKLGDIGGSVSKDAGKLEKRKKSGKVRGKVSSIKALARVQGQLSRGDVYKTINKHIGRIQGCYETQLLKNPSLAGKISFEWTVKTNGSVRGVREISSTVGEPKVSKCVQKVIRRMKFPKPKGGEVEIRYPFIFRSSG